MDTTPHSHTPELKRKYGSYGGGPWEVHYGDTYVTVRGNFLDGIKHAWSISYAAKPTPKRIRRAFLKAVKKHDIGSNKLGDSLPRILTEFERELRRNEWGSDTLGKHPLKLENNEVKQ